MTNHQRTARWLAACGKTPSVGDVSTQIGCDLEEFSEYLRCLRVDSDGWQRVLERAIVDLQDLATEIQKGKRIAHIPNHLRVEALDALCDREVTGNGVAFLAGMDKDGADKAVLDSNDAKLVDGKPVILPGGKIGKPPGWTPPPDRLGRHRNRGLRAPRCGHGRDCLCDWGCSMSKLRDAAQQALEALETVLSDAYHRRFPECCGRPGSECCGNPNEAWAPEDNKIMDALSPVQRQLSDALRAALAEQPAEQEPVAWMPIATAPKGRIVLVYYKNSLGNGRTMRARYYLPETLDSDITESGWADEGWYEESEAYEYLMPLDHEPTHWMPLPAAPDTAPHPKAEQPQHEPVAWGMPRPDGTILDCITPEEHARMEGDYAVPLYTAPLPAKREPLTDEQVAWQPIETAPKGRIVLVYYTNRLGKGRVMRARYYLQDTLESDTTESGWADEGWYEESEAYEYLMLLEGEPTHWMPLPSAPGTAPQPRRNVTYVCPVCAASLERQE